jgi:predicted nucleotidyltransferase
MTTTRFGLSGKTLEEISGVIARHPQVERAVIYGSRAKGNYKSGSDIDLTLFGEALGFDDLLKIMTELDDLLLPYTFDLSIFRMIDHEELREHIGRVGQELYRRQDAAASLEARPA